MTPDEYIKALKNIETLMDIDPDPEVDSDTGIALLELVSKVEAYERRIYPMARVLPDLLTV
jgi:antitoxin component HigA of HigAB toxin-antitoxin module